MYIVHTFDACTEDTAQKMRCFFMVNRAFLGGGYMHEYPEYMWIAPLVIMNILGKVLRAHAKSHPKDVDQLICS